MFDTGEMANSLSAELSAEDQALMLSAKVLEARIYQDPALLAYSQIWLDHHKFSSSSSDMWTFTEFKEGVEHRLPVGLQLQKGLAAFVEGLTKAGLQARFGGAPFANAMLSSSDGVLSDYIPLVGTWRSYLRHSEQKALDQNQLQLMRTVDSANVLDVAMRVVRAAKANPENGAAFDRLLGIHAGILHDDDPEEITAKTGIDLGPVLEPHRDPDGVIRVDNSALVQEAVDVIAANIEPTLSATRNAIVELDAEQQDILALIKKWENDRAAQEAEANRREFDALQRQLTIDAARSSVQLIATAISFGDPELAEEVSITGNAVIQVADAFNSYSATAARLGDLAETFGGSAELGKGLASVVLTGNVVGAAMQVFNLFSKKGPSPEQRMNQMILEQLLALRQQVAQLRTEMHERFDRIDSALNQIYDTLDERLDQVDWNLGVLTGDVTEIQTTLFDLQSDLSRMERNLHAYMDAISQMDLRLEINYALGFEERTGLHLPYHPDYLDAENQFFTWVTDFANDALHAGPESRDYSPSGIHDQFETYSLPFNINYILQYPQEVLGLTPLASLRLGNPLDVGIATDAWLQLARENPGHAAHIASFRLEQMEQEAEWLRGSLLGITNIGTQDAPVANRMLFEALDADYRAKLTAMHGAMEGVLGEYQGDPARRISTFDLWSSSTQQTSYLPSVTTIPSCNGEGSVLPSLPVDWRNVFYIDNAVVNAEALGLTNITACYETQWIETRICKLVFVWRDGWHWECTALPEPGSGAYWQYGRLFVRIKFLFEWAGENVLSASRTWTSGELCLDEHQDSPVPYYGTPSASGVLNQAWQGEWRGPGYCGYTAVEAIGDMFNGTESGVEWALPTGDPSTLEAVRAAVAGTLASHQSAFYSEVVNRLNSITTLSEQAKRLSGSKSAADAFVTLGMASSLRDDDLLRALLLGSGRVPDADVVRQIYLDAIAKLQSGIPVPKIDIAAIANQRMDALQAVITAILDRIELGEQDESNPLINAILRKIAAYQAEVSDSDLDGIWADDDNCIEVVNTDQHDTDGDGFGNRCDGDFNNDGKTNAFDVAILKADFGKNGNLQTDLNGDGKINAFDVSLLKAMFGKPPGPSGLVP